MSAPPIPPAARMLHGTVVMLGAANLARVRVMRYELNRRFRKHLFVVDTHDVVNTGPRAARLGDIVELQHAGGSVFTGVEYAVARVLRNAPTWTDPDTGEVHTYIREDLLACRPTFGPLPRRLLADFVPPVTAMTAGPSRFAPDDDANRIASVVECRLRNFQSILAISGCPAGIRQATSLDLSKGKNAEHITNCSDRKLVTSDEKIAQFTQN